MNIKSVLFFIILMTFWQIFALPVSTSSTLLNMEVSADFLTIGEVSTSSLWYETVMPGYKINYTYNYLNRKNQLHQFGLGIKYFESNTFKLNSADLDPGDLRYLSVNLNGDYKRYLPIRTHVDYITGIEMAGAYNSFGQVITYNAARIDSSCFFKIGSLNGISFNIRDRMEFKTLLSLHAGLPVYGSIDYPDDVEQSVKPYNLGMNFHSGISADIRDIYLCLYYDWFYDYILLLDDSSDYFTPEGLRPESIHSIGLQVGVRL